MANIVTEHRLIDTTNRALIKYTGILDGTGQVAQTAIDVSTLAYAANANGLYHGVTVRRILADVNMPGYVKVDWQGNSGNNTMVVLGQGYKDVTFEGPGYGGVLLNPSTPTNSTGDIVISTVGGAANSSFTVIFDIKKDNNYYTSGFPGA